MTTVVEPRRPVVRDRHLWRCACGYVNADGSACLACEAEVPALAPFDEAWTPLRCLWEQVQADRLAALPHRAPSRWSHTRVPTPAPIARPTRAPRHPGLSPAMSVVVVICLTGLFTAMLAVVGVRRSGPSWPSHWDPRVTSIVAFDEAHRGLRFKHPVPVVFLSDEAFRQKVAGDSAGSSAGDAAAAQRMVAELRALGLATGSPDLAAGSRDVAAQDIEGFYDDKAKTVWVRGDTVTPHLAVILAHELTHVLQDQNFGLWTPADDDAAAAYRALVEADAVRMQNLYLDHMSPADQQSFHKAEDAVGGNVDQVANEVPSVVIDSEQFPYQAGPHFVEALLADRGQAGLDAAFRDPPTSTLQIVEPSLYLAGSRAVGVRPPALNRREHQVDPPSTAGAFQVFEVLADRLDVGQAWLAASTWAGDSSMAYQTGGQICVRTDIATRGDPGVLEGALNAWSAAANRGQVSRHGELVRLDVCDPGPNAGSAPPRHFGPLDALDVRGFMAQGLASDHLSAAAVDCAADVMLQTAGDQGLQRLVDAGNGSDPAPLFQAVESLGLQSRDPVRQRCLGTTSNA